SVLVLTVILSTVGNSDDTDQENSATHNGTKNSRTSRDGTTKSRTTDAELAHLNKTLKKKSRNIQERLDIEDIGFTCDWTNSFIAEKTALPARLDTCDEHELLIFAAEDNATIDTFMTSMSNDEDVSGWYVI